jgi:hypothetical protein
MASAATIRVQVESALARKYPSALTPPPRMVRPVVSSGVVALAAATDPSMQMATPAQRAAVAGYGTTGQPVPCVPGQPCQQPPAYGYAQGNGGGQLSAVQQASQQLQAKERELAYDSRFSSNLVFAQTGSPARGQGGEQTNPSSGIAAPQQSNMMAPREPGASSQAETAATTSLPLVFADAACRGASSCPRLGQAE